MGSRITFQNLVVFLSCIILLNGTMSTASLLDLTLSISLQFGFYKQYNRCPHAEEIVYEVVKNKLSKEPGLGAGLIRMYFHDCFVRGCDASILLDESEQNPNPEKWAIPNNPSLRGYEVIDEAKAALERECTGKVSCADIIAFAARDASYLLGGTAYYQIRSGRYDGRISSADEVLPALPAPFHDLTTQIELFAEKNLSIDDLVALSGAHSIGRSHCSSFISRLYPSIDPTMNEGFGEFLRDQCQQNDVVPQDFVTPYQLDNKYYKNVNELKGLFFSDWSLLTSSETRELLIKFKDDPDFFAKKFAESMVKMGNIGVLNSTQGEIRRNCRAVNAKNY